MLRASGQDRLREARAALEAAFTEIDERWGSFDAYVSKGLQLSPEDITRLRSALLE